MRLLDWVLRGAIVVYWCGVLILGGLVLLGLWMLLRPFLIEDRQLRRGVAPQWIPHRPQDEIGQRDYGDEDQDIVAEGLGTIHPRGHHVTPLEQLTKAERALWRSAMEGAEWL